MHLTIGRKMGLGFGLLLALVATLAIVVLFRLAGMNRQFSFVVQHDAINASARELQKLVIDMETGQRGFVITGKDEFLEPYENAVSSFSGLLDEEKILVSDNPAQVTLLEAIEAAVQEWQEKAAAPEIAMRRRISEATVDAHRLQEMLSEGVGKRLMDRFMALAHEIEIDFSAQGDWEGAFAMEIIEKCMADREDGQRGFLITGREEFLEKYAAGEQKDLPTYFARLRAIVSDRSLEKRLTGKIDRLEELAAEWSHNAAEPEIAARRLMNEHPESLKDVAALLEQGTGKRILDRIRENFGKFITEEERLTAGRFASASQASRRTTNTTALLALASVIFGGFMATRITRGITIPVRSLAGALGRVAKGGLSREIEIKSEDEIGELSRSFNRMVGDLRQLEQDRALADQTLRESEQRFRQLAENIDHVFSLTDCVNQELLYVSPAYEKVYRRSCRSLHDDRLSWLENIHPDEKERVAESFSRGAEAGVYVEEEYRIIHDDGCISWIRDRAFPVRDEEGALYRVICLAEDITERKQTENELRLAAQITEHMAEGINLVRINDGIIVYTNKRLDQIFGYSRGELIGQHVAVLNAAGERSPQETTAEIIKSVETNGSWRGEILDVKKDGTKFWSRAHVSKFEHAEHGPVFLAVQEDITKRKKAEAELRAAEIRSRTLLEGSPVCNKIIDLDSRLQYMSAAGQEMLKIDDIKPYYGCTYPPDFFPEPTRASLVEHLERAKAGEICSLECRGLDTEGVDVWFHTTFVPACDDEGRIEFVIVTSVDITERKQAEAALAASEKRSRTELAELQHIYDAAPVGLCLMDTNLRFLRINQWLANINGISIENHIGRTLHDIIPEIAESMEPVYRKVMETGEPALDVLATGATPADPQDVRHFMASYYPLKSSAGVVWGLSSIVRDVTERKRAEEALNASESRLRSIVESEPECVKTVSRDGTLTEMNAAGLAMIEAESIDQVRGSSVYDLVAPEHLAAFQSLHERVFAGESGVLAFEIIGLKGTRRWMETHAVPLQDQGGEVQAHLSVTRDVTERKRVEEALQKTHSYLKLLKTAAVASNQATDVDSAIQTVLDGVCACTGWTMGAAHVRVAGVADRAEFKQLWHLDDPEHFEPFRTASQKISFEKGIGLPGSVFTTGEPVWVPDIQPMVDELPLGDLAVSLGLRSALFLPVLIGSEVVGILMFSSLQVEEPDRQFLDSMADIGTQLGRVIERKRAEAALREAHEELEQRVEQRTAELVAANARLRDEIQERQEAEREVRASERRYRAVVEDQTELICRWEPDGRLRFVNDAYCRYHDRPREELIGKTFMPSIPDEDHARVQEHFASLTSAEPVGTHQHRVLAPDGQVRWQQWTNRAIFDAQGRLSEYQSVGQDVTERRQSEAQVHQHQEELAHLSRLGTMGEMASGLAHELNQPLASIVNYTSGCVQRIQAGQPNLEQLVDVLKEASSEARRAGEIIKRVRRFVQKREPARSTIDIPELIQQVLHLMRYDLRHQRIQTQLELEPQIPTLQGDRIQLQQVLLNLLRNSVEAMNGLEIRHRRLTIGASVDDADSVSLFVRDAGCGLGEVDSDKIFEPFYTTKEEGTGMGLAISRTIVEAHGGRVSATNNADGGCTFRFSLPRRTKT